MAGTVLSMARESKGWPERVLAWEIRFAKLLLYEHAALRCLGVWTVDTPASEQQVSAGDFDQLLSGDTAAWL